MRTPAQLRAKAAAAAATAAACILVAGCSGGSEAGSAAPQGQPAHTSTAAGATEVATLPTPPMGPFRRTITRTVDRWLTGTHLVQLDGRVWLLTRPADGTVRVVGVAPDADGGPVVTQGPAVRTQDGLLLIDNTTNDPLHGVFGRPTTNPDLVVNDGQLFLVYYTGSKNRPVLNLRPISTNVDNTNPGHVGFSGPPQTVPPKGKRLPQWEWHGQAVMVHRGHPTAPYPGFIRTWYLNTAGTLTHIEPAIGGQSAYVATIGPAGNNMVTIAQARAIVWVNQHPHPIPPLEYTDDGDGTPYRLHVTAATDGGVTVIAEPTDHAADTHLIAVDWSGMTSLMPQQNTGYILIADGGYRNYVMRSPSGEWAYTGTKFFLHTDGATGELVALHSTNTPPVTLTDYAYYTDNNGFFTLPAAKRHYDGQRRLAPVFVSHAGFGFFTPPGREAGRTAQLVTKPLRIVPPNPSP